MNTAAKLSSIVAISMLAACASSTPSAKFVYDEKEDFHTYESFSFVTATSENMEKVEAQGQATDEGLQVYKKLIEEELTKKGFVPGSAEDATFWVLAYAGVDRNLNFVPRESIAATDYKVAKEGVEATLVIDIVDPGDKKVVWRSTVAGHFTDDNTQKRDANLRLIVEQMLSRFPPKK